MMRTRLMNNTHVELRINDILENSDRVVNYHVLPRKVWNPETQRVNSISLGQLLAQRGLRPTSLLSAVC